MRRFFSSLLVVLTVVLTSSCTYDIEGKTFLSADEALSYQKRRIKNSVNRVKYSKHYAGSLLVYFHTHMVEKATENFMVTGHDDFFEQRRKNLLDGLKKALEKSMMFDSVTVKPTGDETDWRTPEDLGYRYVLIIDSWSEMYIHDLLLEKEQKVGVSKRLDEVVEEVATTMEIFHGEEAGSALVKQKEQKSEIVPANEELDFDSKSKKGTISITGRGLFARNYLLKRIGDICSASNVLIKSGDLPPSGYYRILNEQLKDGKLTINFEAR